MATSSESDVHEIVEKRKDQFLKFFKNKISWISYIVLAGIVWLALYIRTLNLGRLRDVTTNDWTLGPDLDPFLFLRWAEYIVEHGKLMALDTMRYVPLGYNPSGEMKLLAYLIAWFHEFLSLFSETSVTHSAVLFPVAAFGFTAIAFFLFSRKLFSKESHLIQNAIALVSTFIFVLIPSLLPRTIAGIPEKESIAFGFMFISFYFFMKAYMYEKKTPRFLFALLAGISTGLMALLWGGSGFVFLTLATAVAFSFLLGKIDRNRFYVFVLWMVVSFAVMMSFSTRYNIRNIVTSITTGSNIAVGFVIFFNLFLFATLHKQIWFGRIFERSKIPREFLSVILAGVILVILSTAIFGVNFIPNRVASAIDQSVHPLDVSRFGLTVAENKQPFFINDWKESFGPNVREIPLYFWLFFIGSVTLFSVMIQELEKKERMLMTFSYVIFLAGLIFSKYSPSSQFNGVSMQSLVFYFGGMIFFLGAFFFTYITRYRKNTFSVFKNFEFGYILYFIVLTLAIIAARGGVRLIMVLGAVSPVAVGFLCIKSIQKYQVEKEDIMKFLFGVLALIVILSTLYSAWIYYQSNVVSAQSYAPGIYQFQWQRAMAWVRDNTPENAVFSHWWDYGYWVQSIGKRATVLDGGNAITYWDYLMGRLVLTEPDETKSIGFLYAHNATHLLIDSTDIGKYPAFSSIGSDENYDRFSSMPGFQLNDQQSVETRTGQLLVYNGGAMVEDDIKIVENGSEVLLRQGEWVLAGILIDFENNTIKKVNGAFLRQSANNEQQQIPLRYAYYQGKKYDFGSGVDAGVFIYPRLVLGNNQQAQLTPYGSIIYLNPRTVHSLVARAYLFDEPSPYFKLIHTEDDEIVSSLQNQGLQGHFVSYGGLRGPIKIWEIRYPRNIEFNPAYLEKNYPNSNLELAKSGYY